MDNIDASVHLAMRILFGIVFAIFVIVFFIEESSKSSKNKDDE